MKKALLALLLIAPLTANAAPCVVHDNICRQKAEALFNIQLMEANGILIHDYVRVYTDPSKDILENEFPEDPDSLKDKKVEALAWVHYRTRVQKAHDMLLAKTGEHVDVDDIVTSATVLTKDLFDDTQTQTPFVINTH
jgi:hypothetical protein